MNYVLKRGFYVCFLLFVLTALFSIQKASGENSKIRVLFIGNSLTFINNLPEMTAQLAKSRHYVLEYDMYAPGGYSLSQHASDPAALRKINDGRWDFVVLQEQSQMPAFSQEQVQREVYPYAKRLCEVIRAANPQAHIVFYATMARKNGDSENISVSAELETYGGTQKRINRSYLTMAQDNRALLAPIGQAWEEVRENRPAIDLYADDVHPNQTGTYLAACVLFSVFFRESPIGISHPSFLDSKVALYLQEATDKIIRSSKWDWEK